MGYHACGMGDRNTVLMSSDLEEVTCNRCLRTVTADKLPRGRPKKPDKFLKKVKALYLKAEDWDWLESQENQAQTIRDAIALYRSNRLKV